VERERGEQEVKSSRRRRRRILGHGEERNEREVRLRQGSRSRPAWWRERQRALQEPGWLARSRTKQLPPKLCLQVCISRDISCFFEITSNEAVTCSVSSAGSLPPNRLAPVILL
jgi:hypothetical protein